MLLNRRALILRMMRFRRSAFAIYQNAYRTLTSAERHQHALPRANRHEARWRDQLNGKDKQRHRGQQAPRAFRMSDCPRHGRSLTRPTPRCHHVKMPQIVLDVNVNVA